MCAAIFDRDNTVTTILTLALGAEGITIVTSSSVEDLMAIAPDIIFVDRTHPLFTADNLQRIYQHIAPVIIALDAMYGFVPEDDHPTIAGWLQKPFTTHQIKQVLTSVAV